MSEDYERRWYGGRDFNGGPQVPCQWQSGSVGRTSVPEPIARLAHEEYARHHGQTFERLHERGGFSPGEIMMLLADALEHERAKRRKS